MNELDEANWRAVDAGERAVSWADFIGAPEGASYLTGAGAALSPRMAQDFTEFVGANWLARVLGTGSPTPGRFPWLGRFSPPMNILGGDQGAAGAFIELVRWWAALASSVETPRLAQVRKDTRRDVSINRFLHTLTQTRLGTIASTLGYQVSYEPPRGDVELRDGDQVVTIEVFSMRTSRAIETQHQLADEMHAHLDALTRTHEVAFSGELPNTSTDLTAWTARVAADAATVARLGTALAVAWDGHELTIEPGFPRIGTRLDGPTIEGEVGSRLYKHALTKAKQIESAANGWLWMENHGAIDIRADVFHLPLEEQLVAYDQLFRPIFETGPASLRGLSFSGAGRRQWPPRPATRAANHLSAGEGAPAASSQAVSEPLFLDRVRTSIHVPRDNGPVADLMSRLVEAEAQWLDLALSNLGVAESARDLIRP